MESEALSLAFGSVPYSRIHKFFLDHIPTPEPTRGPKGGAYYWDSGKQKKHLISKLLHDQLNHPLEKEFSGSLDIDIIFSFPFLRHIPFNKREELKGKPYPSKPQLQHLITMYIDCAYCSIFQADAIIVSLNARKIYGDPGTYLIIKEL
jgi:hypothetical protein